jgi:hypothetical protein
MKLNIIIFAIALDVVLAINSLNASDIDTLAELNRKLKETQEHLANLTLKYNLILQEKSCEASKDWLLVSRRTGRNHREFEKSWNEYKEGFGVPIGNYWIGLEKLSQLTMVPRTIRIEFVEFKAYNDVYFYEYSGFQVADESDLFRLSLGTLLSSRTWNNYKMNEFLNSKGKQFSLKNNLCYGSRPTYAGWWPSNSETSCFPTFCPICNDVSSDSPHGYCYWDESRIYIK